MEEAPKVPEVPEIVVHEEEDPSVDREKSASSSSSSSSSDDESDKEEEAKIASKDDDKKSTSSSSSNEEENDAEAEEETPQDNMEPDTDLMEAEDASEEVVDAPSTSYAKLVTPSGFSLSSQQQSNADDYHVTESADFSSDGYLADPSE